MKPLLELKGITKRFGNVVANDHIDLFLNHGEVLALLGENGAGKTTLMNILYGLYSPDEGEIFINREKIQIDGPQDAINHGIGMVHQHFMLVPVFTVTENVMLGAETTKYGTFLKRKQVKSEIEEISRKYGLVVDPDSRIEDLSVGVQQRVEIIKILYRKAEILIFDEPTAVLTPQEVVDFFVVINGLIKQGKSIIFISHKLKEVLGISDRINVLRNGRLVGEADPQKVTETNLANMMVGRKVFLNAKITEKKVGDKVLEVKNLTVLNERNFPSVSNISFDIKSGEVFGLAGVQGNGQNELVEALFGLRAKAEGKVIFQGQDITEFTPRAIHKLGIGYVPEDRQQDGLILPMPVYNNLIMNSYYNEPFSHGIALQRETIREYSEKWVKEFDIRPPNIDLKTGSLSGGNQQKVIIARELSQSMKLLIASQPTRGLDVGSIEYIHSQLLKKRMEGCAILLFSTELEEIMNLSDRIGVMYRGELISILNSKDATREKLGLLMAGIQSNSR
ncbi:MAG: ABC transporter ATP-binding protein [Chloroflexi bacterium]|nr:ABC transporter ATP-binding protein [Chloroflexota bacterium]